MQTGVLIVVLFASSLFSVWADDESAALEKLLKIPPASESLYAKGSGKLPCVYLTSRGAFINWSQTPIPFDQVLNALANLPKEAWPCGRLIEYYSYPPSVHAMEDKDPLPSDVKKVEADLKAAGIQLMLGTST